MELKVTRVGDNLAIMIPPSAAEKLRIEEGSSLFLTETSSGFEVSASPDKLSHQMQLADQVMRGNRDLLQKLAQS